MVVGAGAAGLAAAVTAERAGASVIVLEAAAAPGGLARSLSVDGYTFDWCGHVLHLRRKATQALMDSVGARDEWVEHERRSAVWIRDRLVPYPFQLHLAHAPQDIREECVAALPTAPVELPDDPADIALSDWIEATLGAGIGRHFMVPYNEKLATVAVAELTREWLGRFAPSPSLRDIRAGAESEREVSPGYNQRFVYPREGGIDLAWRGMAESLGTIETTARVRSVDSTRRRVTLESGDQVTYHEGLLSSVPLNEMCRLVSPHSVALDAGRLLRANTVTCVNAGLKKLPPQFRDLHWTYLPERRYRAHRVGCYSRLSDSMSPPGREGVYVEMAHAFGTPQRDLVAAAVTDLVGLGAINHGDDLEAVTPVRIPQAYVISDRNCAPARRRIQRDLARRGVRMIGRYGRWEYSSLDDALWQGIEAATSVLRGAAARLDPLVRS